MAESVTTKPACLVIGLPKRFHEIVPMDFLESVLSNKHSNFTDAGKTQPKHPLKLQMVFRKDVRVTMHSHVLEEFQLKCGLFAPVGKIME